MAAHLPSPCAKPRATDTDTALHTAVRRYAASRVADGAADEAADKAAVKAAYLRATAHSQPIAWQLRVLLRHASELRDLHLQQDEAEL